MACAASPAKNGAINVLLYETAGRAGEALLHFKTTVQSAQAVTLFGQASDADVSVRDGTVCCKLPPYRLMQVQVTL